MKKTYTLISAILLAVLITGLPAGPASAEEKTFGRRQADQLLALFNQARQEPLTMAAALGLDPDQLLSDLPELQDVLSNGLPALIQDQRLALAAEEHITDMLKNSYYETTSPMGRTPYDRITAAGYRPGTNREVIALLSIKNLLTADLAVRHLFTNIFLDELRPERAEPRNLLNPAISETGIAVQTGRLNLNGNDLNVILAACNFTSGEITEISAEELETMAAQLTVLLNQARLRPGPASAAVGINLSAGCPQLFDPAEEPLPPLYPDAELTRLAENRAAALAAGDHIDPGSSTGYPLEERLEQAGFVPLTGGELTVRVPAAGFPSRESAVNALFRRIIESENNTGCRTAPLFNDGIDSLGAALDLARLPDEQGEEQWYYLAALELAEPLEPANPALMGVVYRDSDGNGLYSPGEGRGGRPVIYYGAGLHLRTGPAGTVAARLNPGWYLVILHSSTEDLRYIEKNVINQHVWFDIDLNGQ